MMECCRKQAIRQIKELWQLFVGCRSFFPFMDEQVIGQEFIATPDCYDDRTFIYPRKLDENDVARNNDAAHFINEAYVFRLNAILEDNRLAIYAPRNIDNIPGTKDIRFVKQLSNIIRHENGRFKGKKRQHMMLLEEMNNYYGVIPDKNRISFNLDIGKILVPMTKNILEYINICAEKTESIRQMMERDIPQAKCIIDSIPDLQYLRSSISSVMRSVGELALVHTDNDLIDGFIIVHDCGDFAILSALAVINNIGDVGIEDELIGRAIEILEKRQCREIISCQESAYDHLIKCNWLEREMKIIYREV